MLGRLQRIGRPVLAASAVTVAVLAYGGASWAAEDPVALNAFAVNNLWMMMAAALVFIMHPGFACLEVGLTRSKNTVNILFKNTLIVAIGLLTYAIIGFSLMYPDAAYKGGWYGWNGLGLNMPANGLTPDYAAYTYYTDFIFQGMFAATAATIVSGAVAERIKLPSFLIFSALYVGLCYPIPGMWIWGKGWLSAAGFHDFAGSTAVHSVGGWAALAGIILLGARLGKYGPDGSSKPIPGHSMPLAMIGVFLLWFGWYGFNGGSVLSADPAAVSRVFVTTSLAAAAGVITAMIASWTIQRKPDLTMVLNGALAGLVGITAGADWTTPFGAVVVGAIAGVLVVLSVLFFDQVLRLDDPVGATSVHLVCGIWGTLAVGLFSAQGVLGLVDDKGKVMVNAGLFYGGGMTQLLAQCKGVAMVGVFCFLAGLALFALLKYTLGIRVHRDEELAGLDIGEHGMESYSGFQIFLNQ